jgi:fumarate reductase flavoprotein subunit
LDQALGRALAPLRPGDAGRLAGLRERLAALMWDKVGILRSELELAEAESMLAGLAAELAGTGIGTTDPAFNLAWHEWLNLDSLILISRVITRAARTRPESRGAHFRSDATAIGGLAASYYTEVCWPDGEPVATRQPVRFTRVRPPGPESRR